MGSKAPEPTGPSADDLARQAEAERVSKDKDTAAGKEVQSQSRAAYGRRTGRRVLLAPGREDEMAKTLGG
jgi:hypothetical protein